ncbi:RNA polymerase sigma factor [Arabiibacter massiliensis]|uniref:RNA polymerase sigma factor n=1 Tax=Arabiibacter massiliensis TaxID=1870985 RepID=UPI0009BAB4DC
MRRWGSTVLRLALNQMRSPADAEDVFQDVFLRLLKDRTAFRDEEHLKAWLLRVTVNRCHDLQRSGKRRACDQLDGNATTIEAPDLFASDVWEVVGQLPDDLRAVVHLHYVEGYATKEIARIVDCPPATVRTRLHRAREALKKALADPMPPSAPAEPRPLNPPSTSPGKEASHELRSRQRLCCENAAGECIRPPA